MIDLAQFLTVSGLATFLVLITQALKAYLPPADVRLIPFATLGLGVLFALLFALATGHITDVSGWVNYGVGGLISGFVAIGGYESSIDKMLNAPSATAPMRGPGELVDGHALPPS